MKKLLLPVAFLLICAMAGAQPWLKKNDGTPQKLQDIVEAYRADKGNVNIEEENEEENGGIKEGENYQFSRWQWYWERHLDADGYMVSPVQTVREWRTWLNTHKRAQSKTTTSANTSNWTFQGPQTSTANGNGVGRINVVSFHPTDSNTIWIGSAGGGAWKTTDGGINWAAVNDNFPVLSVSDIDFNPLNPNTIYVCTGDREASDSYSVGVLKSTDGGLSWDTTGLKWDIKQLKLTNSLVINPIDTNSLVLATNDGIYRSYDGGANFTKVKTGNFKQLATNSFDTGVVYAVGDTGFSYQVYRSKDGGTTWDTTTRFPSNTRLTIATTPANPGIVKAIVSNASFGLEGVYSSSDTGKHFTKIFTDNNCANNILANAPSGTGCGGQGWYDLALAINPTDSNQMTMGGVNTWYSGDGGFHWTIANQWSGFLAGTKIVHADKHFQAFSPLMTNTVFECNDGGIYKCNKIGSLAWTDLTNGLGITEFYRIALSENASFAIGGAQDNGSKKVNNGTNQQLTGGDGMDCAIEPTNPLNLYTTTQYGSINRSSNGGGNFSNISQNIPGGQPTGNWITPIAVVPKLEYLLAGFNKLYTTDNRGSTWTAISPSFGANIDRISTSLSNPSYVYVIVNNNIQSTTDYGQNWKRISVPYSGTISDLHVDPRDETHIWICYSGYGATKVADYTPAKGWTLRNDQLPNISINCITIDPADEAVYLGTDVGVFYRIGDMTTWDTYGNGLPMVEVIDLDINNTNGELWAGTYGRAMWKTPTISFPTVIGTVPFATDAVTAYPNPNNGQFEIRTDNKSLIDQNVRLNIVGVTGIVNQEIETHINASGKASVNTQLPRGTYIVNVYKGTMLYARTKMIVFN